MPDVETSAIQINITAADNASKVIENITRKLEAFRDVLNNAKSAWDSFSNSGAAADNLKSAARSLGRISKVNLDNIDFSKAINGAIQFSATLAVAERSMKTFDNTAENARSIWQQNQEHTSNQNAAAAAEEAEKPISLVNAVAEELAGTVGKVKVELNQATQEAQNLARATQETAQYAKTINFNTGAAQSAAEAEKTVKQSTDQMSKDWERVQQKIQEAQKIGQKPNLSAHEKFVLHENDIEQYKKLYSAIDEVDKKTEETSNTFQNFFSKVNDSRMKATASGVDGIAGSLGKMVSVVGVATAAINALGKVIKIHFVLFKSLVEATVKGLTKLVQITGQLMQVTAKVSFYMGKAFGTVMLTPIRLLGNTLGKIVTKLKEMFAGLVRIATYRLFRSVIKMITKGLSDGITALYQWSKALDQSFSKTMDLYATDQQYLNNSIAAMLEPLLETLIPMLDEAIDKFVELLNKVNQFMSALAGKSTWTKAKKVPKEYQEAAENAKKATDDLKRSLMGFDEINRLDKEKTSKGKKGKTVPDYSSMFEELPIESKIADLAKAIKKLIKNGEWFEAGALLANKLNELIEAWDTEKAGRLLAKKINGVVDFARGFITTAKWKKLGTKISETLNNFFRNLNAKNIGRLIADNINAAFDFALGFFSTFDGSTFGKRIADLINGFFEEIDAATIGDTISAVLTKALDAGISFFNNLNTDAFYGSIITLIGHTDFEGIGDKVAELLKSAVKTIDEDKISTIFNNLIQEISGFIQNAIDNGTIAELVTKITGTLAKILGNKETIKSVAKGFETLLKAVITAAGTFIQTFPVSDLFNSITTFFRNIHWADIGKEIGSYLQDGINQINPDDIAETITTVFDSALKLLSNITDKMDEKVEVVVGKKKVGPSWAGKREVDDKQEMTYWEAFGVKIGQAIANGLKNFNWEKAADVLNSLVLGITGLIKNALDQIVKDSETQEKLTDFFNSINWQDLIDNIIDIMQDMDNLFGQALRSLGYAIAGILAASIVDGLMSLLPESLQESLDWLPKLVGKHFVNIGQLTSGGYATGGFPDEGEFFYAREAGPELVGTIGGKTAVANNDDIVAAVSAGVYEATAAANASNNGASNITVSVDGDNLFNFFVKKHNGAVKQTGVTPLYV